MRMGVFHDWQPVYAEHGIATFPVTIDENGKRPAVRGYLKAGKRASAAWASRFADASALGFAVRPNRITVLDVDTADERVLADAMDRHGRTPLVVRSQSGNFQAYYRNNGETRRVRPWEGLPIDVLGHGFTVAPPSKGQKGSYEIIAGSLDDLDRLPKLHGLPAVSDKALVQPDEPKSIGIGRRNTALFNQAMKLAHECNDEAELYEAARRYADTTFTPVLDEAEIRCTVASAWEYTARGENYAGLPGRVVVTGDEYKELMPKYADAYMLLSTLRHFNGSREAFLVADNMAGTIVPMTRKRLSKARAELVSRGYIVRLRGPSSKHGAALYAWP